MSNFTAVYDACVLYPSPLRSFLMYLALTDLFRARWSQQIHEEWMRNVVANFPDISQQQVERIRDFMNEHVRDCLVTDYESLVDALKLPDPDDRHVLAAAIHCRASVIVTFNLKDFPESELSKYQIEAQHPDEFCAHLFDLSPDVVCQAARLQRASMKNPPKTVAEYLELLATQGMKSTSEFLTECKELL